MDLFPNLLIAPLLIYAAYSDLRYMRIPDFISIALVALFTVMILIQFPTDFGARIAVASGIFAIGYAGFSLRLVGGGDVKFLSALALFVPRSELTVFANLFSFSLLVGIFMICVAQRSRLANVGWKSFSARGRFPMGLSIAMAGLMLPVVFSSG